MPNPATQVSREQFDVLLPSEQNGGGYRHVSLCPGLDFVFVTSAKSAGFASGCGEGRLRLFGDPALQDFSIEEVSEGGAVPFLRATNNSVFGVMLIAGQLIRGGKQNRGVSTDIFVEAGQSAQIPVTCVEQGRWSGRPGSRFDAAGVEPISIRCSKFRGVSASRRGSGGFAADQQAVWNDIHEMSACLHAPSASGDLLESIGKVHQRRVDGTEPNAAADTMPSSIDEEIRHLERRLQEAQEAAIGMLDHFRHLVRTGATDELAHRRRELDAALRDAGVLQQRLDRARRRKLEFATGRETPRTVDRERIAEADSAAHGAIGLLVFFNGEFLAGDLFLRPEWFARFYAQLRDSALLSWEMVATRCARERREMDLNAGHKARSMASTIVADAFRGSWVDRPAAAHGVAQMLEHPFLEGSLLAGPDGWPLHVLIGSKRTPEILRPRNPRSER